jgi:outer membrane lipoprotein SlyB
MNTNALIYTTLIVAVVGLSGCATSPSNENGSTSKDTQRTQKEGALFGAVVGGLLGAALGDDNRGQGALIGAVVGAGVGYAVGNEVAKRKSQYATEEEFLDAEIVSAQDLNITAEQYNAKLQQDIERLETRTLALRAEYDAGRAAQSRMESEREAVESQIASTDKVLDDLTKEHEIKLAIHKEQLEKRGVDDVQVAQLEHEIALLKENIDELNQHSQQLASIDERLAR